MKKTHLLIMAESDNSNLVYTSVVNYAKQEISKYFGSRITHFGDNVFPVVTVDHEVTPEDLDMLKRLIDQDTIKLVAVIGLDEHPGFKGDILDLTNK